MSFERAALSTAETYFPDSEKYTWPRKLLSGAKHRS